ncbi:MAG: hypothetical protein M3O70_05345 [Actinomycetota bacterium]|nr:hypothetical protein [Actinomycetota bacterium]
MKKDNTAYRAAVAVAVAAALILVWAIGALGVIGAEGDRADHMYLGVLGVGIGGAVGARFEAEGMARALSAAAIAQVLVAVIALLMGEHQSPVTSVFEILAVNGMFVALFLGSAGLFQKAAREQPCAGAAAKGLTHAPTIGRETAD